MVCHPRPVFMLRPSRCSCGHHAAPHCTADSTISSGDEGHDRRIFLTKGSINDKRDVCLWCQKVYSVVCARARAHRRINITSMPFYHLY